MRPGLCRPRGGSLTIRGDAITLTEPQQDEDGTEPTSPTTADDATEPTATAMK